MDTLFWSGICAVASSVLLLSWPFIAWAVLLIGFAMLLVSGVYFFKVECYSFGAQFCKGHPEMEAYFEDRLRKTEGLARRRR